MGHRWRSAARTHAGHVRPINEDAVLDRPDAGLWAVADGLGGHHQGALASRLVIDHLDALALHGSLNDRASAVMACLQRTNRWLASASGQAGRNPALIMGSTIVVVVALGGRACCIWAGDSRCYLWRQDQLYQLSRDHAAVPTDARPGGLTRAVGAHQDLLLERVEFSAQWGDALLLCSDGLYRQASNQALAHAMRLPLATVAVDQLVGQVLRGRAPDNLSAVVMRQ